MPHTFSTLPSCTSCHSWVYVICFIRSGRQKLPSFSLVESNHLDGSGTRDSFASNRRPFFRPAQSTDRLVIMDAYGNRCQRQSVRARIVGVQRKHGQILGNHRGGLLQGTY